MSRMVLVMIGMTIGSIVGGYIPTLFGVSFLSMMSLIGNAIGGFVGIFVAYKLTVGM